MATVHHKPRILAFSGSLKSNSWNQMLARSAAQIARDKGAEVNLISLRDYPLPLFNEDIEKNPNPVLNDIRGLFHNADALIIASPEYNGSITPALKNVIDWVSRPNADEGYSPKYAQQTAAIMAASPGGLGGLRGLTHLREILTNLGTVVAPTQLAVPAAYEAFNEQGELINAAMNDRLEAVIGQLMQLTAKQ